MSKVAQGIKFVVVFLLVIFFILIALPLYPVLRWTKLEVRPLISWWTGRVGNGILKVLGIKVFFTGELPQGSGHLIVSNHMSYLDVLILSKRLPASFVTSIEIRDTLGLGQICLVAGCLFVERRNRKNLDQEVLEITNALERGLSVAVFPEATSTNGENVLRFKRPLFKAATNSGRSVLPVCINYVSINGVKVEPANRDILCWYDEMNFFPHLWTLCSIRCANIEVAVHESISTLENQADYQEIAEKSHRIISETFRPICSELSSQKTNGPNFPV